MDELCILAALVAATPWRGVFTLAPVAGTDDWQFAGVAGWPNTVPVPSAVVIDDLAARCWVRITERRGHTRTFALTHDGRQAHRLHADAEARAARVPADLTWPSARAVLHLVHTAYREQGAPEAGVKTPQIVDRLDNPASGGPVLRELIRAGYLESSFAGSGEIPVMVRPTVKTLELEEGWPASSAEAIVDELVDALDREIDRTADDEERSKLIRVRDGMLSVARDLVLKWAETKLGGIGP